MKKLIDTDFEYRSMLTNKNFSDQTFHIDFYEDGTVMVVRIKGKNSRVTDTTVRQKLADLTNLSKTGCRHILIVESAVNTRYSFLKKTIDGKYGFHQEGGDDEYNVVSVYANSALYEWINEHLTFSRDPIKGPAEIGINLQTKRVQSVAFCDSDIINLYFNKTDISNSIDVSDPEKYIATLLMINKWYALID